MAHDFRDEANICLHGNTVFVTKLTFLTPYSVLNLRFECECSSIQYKQIEIVFVLYNDTKKSYQQNFNDFFFISKHPLLFNTILSIN